VWRYLISPVADAAGLVFVFLTSCLILDALSLFDVHSLAVVTSAVCGFLYWQTKYHQERIKLLTEQINQSRVYLDEPPNGSPACYSESAEDDNVIDVEIVDDSEG